jgi:hypothetical protein
MRWRLAAAAAGAVLIAAAVLAFSLAGHPVIAGTNSAAPLLPAVVIQPDQTRCQPVARVPGGADHVRVVAFDAGGQHGQLKLSIRGETGPVAVGRGPIGMGGHVIRLGSPTRALHPAKVCMRYSGRGHVILAGEKKRVAASGRIGRRPKRGVASLVFLRSGLESWASRRDVIADRYANAQTGPFGEWTLWLAVIAAIGAATLGLWWMAFRADGSAARGERS